MMKSDKHHKCNDGLGLWKTRSNIGAATKQRALRIGTSSDRSSDI